MSHWKRITFARAVETLPTKNKIKTSDILSTGQTPVVDQSTNMIAGFTNSPVFYTNPPYIIFGDHTRSVKYVDFSFNPGADGVKVLKVNNENLDSEFVYEYLRFTPIQNLGYSRHFKLLKEITIPEPPLEEQRRIAIILTECNNSIKRQRITIERLKEILNAVFYQRFGSPYQNQKQLPPRKLSELAVIKTGNTPPRSVATNYGDFIPWVKSDNLGDWEITIPEESLSKQGAQKGRIAEPGSILVTCIAGSIKSIGKSSLIEHEVAFNQQINSLTPKPNMSNSAFLFAALNSYPNLVRDKSTGGLKGIVKKSAFEDITLPVPPMREQQSFSLLFEKLRDIVNLRSRKLTLLEELHQSLAARAFAGQL
ncbi:restriction endonuclease subunit S [Corynebacterium sp.]|uniref:restriction endonuclease subunit S n=1 Tax=Corynebacterium sp. TaxID=1720 RepID=UPI0029030BF9|nr:restriction endonuclease subunit S [Corynebacterium sp.]MDU3110277.1 restriction endonuclease subunit S [Corynebacterium sp.]